MARSCGASARARWHDWRTGPSLARAQHRGVFGGTATLLGGALDMTMRVLIAVDEPTLRARVAELLQSCGYVTVVAPNKPSEAPAPTNLGAAIVAPASFDHASLALARQLCGNGCKVILLTLSPETARRASRLLPQAVAFPAQPLDQQRLVRHLAQIAALETGEESPPRPVLQFEGRSLDLGGHAFIDENGREVPLPHA